MLVMINPCPAVGRLICVSQELMRAFGERLLCNQSPFIWLMASSLCWVRFHSVGFSSKKEVVSSIKCFPPTLLPSAQLSLRASLISPWPICGGPHVLL